MPARGTPEGAELWEQYAARCRVAAPEVVPIGSAAAPTTPPQVSFQKAVEVVEEKIRLELKLRKPDPLLQPLVQLFERGDLITIDKGSRIPPLEMGSPAISVQL